MRGRDRVKRMAHFVKENQEETREGEREKEREREGEERRGEARGIDGEPERNRRNEFISANATS